MTIGSVLDANASPPPLTATASRATNSDIPQDLPDSYSYRLKQAQNSMVSLTEKEKKLGDPSLNEIRQKWVFHQVLQPLYGEINILKEKINVLILGVVDIDGVGDYFHMLHAGQEIQKSFSNATITLGARVIDLRSMKRENRFPVSEFQTFLWEDERDASIREECIKVAKTASLILDISHKIYANDLLLKSHFTMERGHELYSRFGKAIPYTRILEYASNNRGQFTQSKGKQWYGKKPKPFYSDKNSMGIDSFELGLMWRSPSSDDPRLTSLKDPTLQSLLFSSDLNQSEEVDLEKNYFQTHSLHFGYLHQKKVIDIFVKTCLHLHRTDPIPFIDIIIHNTLKHAKKLIPQLDSEGYLSDVKQIYFHNRPSPTDSSSQPWTTSVWEPSKRGENAHKIIRLIDPFPIAPNDVQTLMRISKEPIGCTGDNSISEDLSYDRIPFFEALLFKPFFANLTSLADEFFQSPDNLCTQYFKAVDQLRFAGKNKNKDDLNKDIEKTTQLLSNKRLSLEMNQFIQFLKKHYNFNEVLIDIVSREILRKQFPELKAKEKELYSAYSDNQKSLESCYKEYRQFITTLKQSRTFSILPITEISPELKAIPNKITIAVKIDLGNSPYEKKDLWLRGAGVPGLNWNDGVAMKKTEQALWTWEVSNLAFSKMEFKVLIEDQKWEKGPNHEIQAKEGETYVEITPNF